jgi:hypothetical protein
MADGRGRARLIGQIHAASRDIVVHHQCFVIRGAKTDARVREFDLSVDVMAELMTWGASCGDRR